MLLHADNFNYYGGTEGYMDDGIYAEIQGPSSLVADPDGVSTTKVFKMNWQNTYMWRWVLPAAVATVGIAQRVYLANIPADANSTPNIFQWADGTNTLMCAVRVNPTGGLDFYNGATLVGSTAVPVISAHGWYHMEAKLTAGLAGAGAIEVRVEGVSVLSLSGFSTSAATVSQVRGSSGHGSSSYTTTYIRDLVIWDGSGTQNNDFLGSVLVYELLTTSDAALNWTSTGANGYSVLQNNPPQDGVAYIAAANPPPAASKFGLTDLPADVSSVKGLITRVRAAKSDGGDGSLQVGLVSGASTDLGADRPITTSQTYWSDVSELDPATAAAWLPGAVNNAQLQVNRTL